MTQNIKMKLIQNKQVTGHLIGAKFGPQVPADRAISYKCLIKTGTDQS